MREKTGASNASNYKFTVHEGRSFLGERLPHNRSNGVLKGKKGFSTAGKLLDR